MALKIVIMPLTIPIVAACKTRNCQAFVVKLAIAGQMEFESMLFGREGGPGPQNRGWPGDRA
jgi:hypothetical protein